MKRLPNGICVETPGEGKMLQVLADTITLKLTAKDTGGAMTLFETVTPPGMGTPPHIHHREDETFYILEGELEFWSEAGTIRGGPGTVAHLPRNEMHCFTNVGLIPARFLVMATPSGIEEFFAEVAALPAGPPDIPRIVAIGANYGIEIPPPPPPPAG